MALLQNIVNSTFEHYFATYMFNFLVVKYEKKSFFNWMVDLQCDHITQLIIPSKTYFLYFI